MLIIDNSNKKSYGKNNEKVKQLTMSLKGVNIQVNSQDSFFFQFNKFLFRFGFN